MSVGDISKVLIVSGSICIIAGAMLFTYDNKQKKMFRITRILMICGVVLVALSAIIPALRQILH